MSGRYVQFLGSRPGIVVELIDDSGSPYVVRAESGFEFSISAEDFRHYYRPEGGPTPPRWLPFVTEPETGMIEAGKISKVMEMIHSLEGEFQDFAKARAFLRDALKMMGDQSKPNLRAVRLGLQEGGWNQGDETDRALEELTRLPQDVRLLLLSDTTAVIPLFTGIEGEEVPSATQDGPPRIKPVRPEGARPAAKVRRVGMKNAEMSVEGDILTITVDLSKEFGPSKSGKTIIVASSEGNKSVPGRTEKIGLNIYKQPGKKAAKGRRSTFKNVEMDVEGDNLTVKVDLSKELGPSKSGKTTMVATTEGNQLVYGREEKIGLNVYRKID
ncbi:MAG: hypothetical protein HY913_23690 [Desulfomonile tiedjei]|nr:hypothetical protein [Desulfomonile tiedjei]